MLEKFIKMKRDIHREKAKIIYKHIEVEPNERKQYTKELNYDDILRLDSLVLSHMFEMQRKGIPDKKTYIKTRSLNMKLSKMIVDMKLSKIDG